MRQSGSRTQLLEQRDGAVDGGGGHFRIQALLEAGGAVAADAGADAGAPDALGAEDRRLEQDRAGVRLHHAVLAAHDPGQGQRAGAVGDQQVAHRQGVLLAIEGAERNAHIRATLGDALLNLRGEI